jgi:hypothetical protein
MQRSRVQYVLLSLELTAGTGVSAWAQRDTFQYTKAYGRKALGG